MYFFYKINLYLRLRNNHFYSMKRYDDTSVADVLRHARLLLGKSLADLYPEVGYYSTGKGGLGQAVEKFHFDYEPNSTPEADFHNIGAELKITPLKQMSDGSMVSKERLVLNIIDYVAEADTTFETSSFWHKSNLLLLMFYLHESGVNVVQLIFKIIRYWRFPEEDLKIIKDDWEKIHKKLVEGKAHTLSEGDTLYLGACTKGSKGGANKRPQKNSSILADQRAYSLKSKYINAIILDSLFHSEMWDNLTISEKQKQKIIKSLGDSSSIVKSMADYQHNETFEELVSRKFAPYIGKSVEEIGQMCNVVISDSPKAVSTSVIKGIFGIKTPKITEFEKANLQLKTIRLEHNGNLKEAMVFSQIQYDELMDEEVWEESVWHETLTQRFLFVIFRKSDDNNDKKAVLERIKFWTMPPEDLALAKLFWQDTRDKVRRGDFENFISQTSGNICHVRPKAENSLDLQNTKFGPQKKKGYWLNREYVLKVVRG